VGRITDPVVLARIAASDRSEEVRWAAVNVLTDQASLAGIAARDASPRVRARAAARIADQDAIARLATTDPDPDVRKEATARITDPSLRRRIAAKDAAPPVRRTALDGLPDDPAFFRAVALGDKSSEVRAYAVARLSDTATLASIVKNDTSPAVQAVALRRLSDPAAIAGIATGNRSWVLRRDAVERLTDPKMLASVAASDADEDVRRAALDRLDEKTIGGLCTSAGSPAARAQAVGLVSNQEFLEQIASGKDAIAVRLAAVAALSDRDALRRVLDTASDPEVRGAAEVRMIGLQGESPDPRNLTLRRILAERALTDHYGTLDLDFRIWTDEKRYVREDDDASTNPPKGKVVSEFITVSVRQGTKVLYRKTFRARKPRKSEVFAQGSLREEGYGVKLNRAEIDYLEICEALLAPLDDGALAVAARSNNKYLSASAHALLDDAHRGLVPSKRTEPEGEGDDD